VLGELPLWLWALVVSNLLWVLAYDTEYAMVDRDDDLTIGMKTSAITLGRYDVAGVMLFYATHLLVWAWAVWPLAAGVWVAAALVVAAAQAAWHFVLIRQRIREGCFKAFRLNHWLGLTLFAGVVLQLAAA
jgi:4-hydroxybenzoate polyprenyltransferase